MSATHSLGLPRLHLRRTDSTNHRAREMAVRGAPHGTLVTASEQSAGRGRQGRTWSTPPGQALLCSLVIRDPSRLLSLAAGIAVAEVVSPRARLKWPNDVLVDGRKVAGILVEGRPQERWAVLGIGLNVALRVEDLPPETRARAGSLGLGAEAVEPILERLLHHLERWTVADVDSVLDQVRRRDALLGERIRWLGGQGVADGVDRAGRLVVLSGGHRLLLEAGEVHFA